MINGRGKKNKHIPSAVFCDVKDYFTSLHSEQGNHSLVKLLRTHRLLKCDKGPQPVAAFL